MTIQRFDRVRCPVCGRTISVSWVNQHGYAGLRPHYTPEREACSSWGRGYLVVNIDLVASEPSKFASPIPEDGTW